MQSTRQFGLLSIATFAIACGATATGGEAGLVAPHASVQKLADGFMFTEGPAVDAEGNVYFSDVRSSRTHKWSTDGKLTTFREETGNANGLFFDRSGNLLACEGGSRRVTRVAMDGTVSVLADQFGGKKLNSPNDLWPDPKGGIYFTDPRYGSEEGLEQDGFHVYYIPPDGTPIRRVVDDLKKPNGVLGTADGTHLYVADPGANETYVYAIQSDGSLAGRRLAAPEGSDGMTLDERGNLYLTREGVEVYSPTGKKIASFAIPERPANVVFGGVDLKTLYITARTGLYSLEMQVRGQTIR
ncbi:MAG: SMP-30/gluconolactonase/LRE family protein [Planctomycetaceae bacterium]|nr:SMP-30/gluconolactonase/LRE family protein [Planctomycetaceae bacterium]MCB9941421.1 SMP-30/gluconolactonase/LRE family protein [Planctomycetaceae bacterium]